MNPTWFRQLKSDWLTRETRWMLLKAGAAIRQRYFLRRYMGVTTRKCQNCPVRESQTWTLLGVEREFGSIERVEDTEEGIWSSLQREKRPLDCLISIAKQSFSADCRLGHLENRVSARIARRSLVSFANRTICALSPFTRYLSDSSISAKFRSVSRPSGFGR
jgi:hypothetical protein